MISDREPLPGGNRQQPTGTRSIGRLYPDEFITVSVYLQPKETGVVADSRPITSREQRAALRDS